MYNHGELYEAKINAASRELQHQVELVRNTDTKASILLAAIGILCTIFFSADFIKNYSIVEYSALFYIASIMLSVGVIMLILVLLPCSVKDGKSILYILRAKQAYEDSKKYIETGIRNAQDGETLLQTVLEHQTEQAKHHAIIAKTKYNLFFWGASATALGMFLFVILSMLVTAPWL